MGKKANCIFWKIWYESFIDEPRVWRIIQVDATADGGVLPEGINSPVVIKFCVYINHH